MGRRASVEEPEDPGLEALNLVNMIIHYKDELTQVRNGATTNDVFTPRERHNLRRAGALVSKQGSSKCGSILMLHWGVEAILDRLN